MYGPITPHTAPYWMPPIPKEDEEAMLEEEAKMLGEELECIKRRLEELKK
jgi:hypothetical protein